MKHRGVGSTATQLPTLTHCPYCSLQCGVSMVAGDRPATLQPQPDFPTNLGGLCSKGWNATDLLDHPQRLLSPLLRTVPGDRTSPFRAATWDEALDAIVTGIRRAQTRYGPDGVGCFGGGGLTNEKAYAFGKFARVALRTSMIDYNGRFCMSSAATAGNRAFGIDRGLPFPLADLADADTILLVGSNPAATMPPAMQFFDAGRPARRAAHRRRPAAHPDRRGLDAAPPTRPGHRPRPRERHAPHRDPRGMGRRRVRRAAHEGVCVGARRRLLVLAGPGRADHRGPRRRPVPGHRVARDRTESHGPHRPRRRAAQPRNRHRAGVRQPRAGPRSAGAPRERVRHDHRPGQRPGRPRARPEGRPAPRVPQARRPRRPRARRGRLGDRPGRAPRSPASPRSRCSTGWARPAASGP